MQTKMDEAVEVAEKEGAETLQEVKPSTPISNNPNIHQPKYPNVHQPLHQL